MRPGELFHRPLRRILFDRSSVVFFVSLQSSGDLNHMEELNMGLNRLGREIVFLGQLVELALIVVT